MEKYQPKISIIMPLYNAEKYVNMAIRSVLEQTYANWELVIVDDKSTDKSSELCEEWAKKDTRIRVIHLQKNQGAGHARNIGMEQAKGDYITFLDADDAIEKDLYEKVLEASNGKMLDIYVWGVTEQYYNRDNQVVMENKLFLPSQLCESVDELRKQVICLEDKTLFGYQWNHLYKREILQENKIQFEKVVLYEDYFFNMKVIQYARSLCIVEKTGYYYAKRMNQSITNKYVADYFSLSKRRVSEMLQAYKQWNLLDDKVKESCGNRYLRYISSAFMRNNDKLAHMSLRNQIEWIQKIFCDPLYLEISKECKTNQALLKLTQQFINMKFAWGCFGLGKVLYILKYKFPSIFSKKSVIKK